MQDALLTGAPAGQRWQAEKADGLLAYWASACPANCIRTPPTPPYPQAHPTPPPTLLPADPAIRCPMGLAAVLKCARAKPREAVRFLGYATAVVGIAPSGIDLAKITGKQCLGHTLCRTGLWACGRLKVGKHACCAARWGMGND